jgi:putative ABC transport system permease protein
VTAPRRLFGFPWRTARRISEDVDDELAFHLDMRTNALVEMGRDRAEARAQALREFGDLDDARRSIGAMDRGTEAAYRRNDMLNDFSLDVRYALRKVRRAPAFAAAVIGTLVLGIGATTAIFSVVNGVLLEPLAYPRSDRIVRLFPLSATGERNSASQPTLHDWSAGVNDFAALAIFHPAYKSTVTGAGEPLNANVSQVSHDFFAVFGTRPAIGRLFSDEETRYGGPRAVIVSDAFWRRALGASPSAIGRRLTIEGDLYSIVGIVPPVMSYPASNDVWIPVELSPENPSRTTGGWGMVGRIRDGESVAQVARDVSRLARRLKVQFGAETTTSDAQVIPLRDQMVGNVRTPLLVLLAASAVLLIIAIANAVNLLVARLALRQGELAVRVALGATQTRLMGQLVVEALILSVTAGLIGLSLAAFGVHAMMHLDGIAIPRAGDVHVDARALAFAATISLAAALLLGLLAAWHAARRDVRQTLSANGRSSTGGSLRVRRTLVIAQMASTVVLLAGAGVLGRSFLKLMAVSPGFRVDHLLIVDAASNLSGPELALFEQRLLNRLRAQPGVSAVGGAIGVPLAGGAPDGGYVLLDNPAEAPTKYDPALWHTPGRTGSANFARVEGDFFKAMGIPLLRGRDFGPMDTPGAPHVAVVNAAFAKMAWPNADPLGRLVEYGNMDGNMRPFTVVGVVGDAHDDALASPPTPTLYAYQPQRQSGWAPTIVIQTAADPGAMIASVRRIIHEVGPSIAPEFRTMDHVLSASVADRRFILMLIATFSGTALLLATLGVYSVVAYLVEQRRREIGVRVALGASRGMIVGLVMRQGAWLALIGVAIGVVGARAATGLLEGMMYGVSPNDPIAFGGVVGLLIGVGLLASYVPAMRATRVNPVDVLRGG